MELFDQYVFSIVFSENILIGLEDAPGGFTNILTVVSLDYDIHCKSVTTVPLEYPPMISICDPEPGNGRDETMLASQIQLGLDAVPVLGPG